MLYNLFTPLADHFIVFNLFRYLTFRSGAACITGLAFSLVLGPCFIRWLSRCSATASRSARTARRAT